MRIQVKLIERIIRIFYLEERAASSSRLVQLLKKANLGS